MSHHRKPLSRAMLALAGGVAVLAAAPALAERYVDWAPVLSSTPVYQRVSQPRQECWTETVAVNEVRRTPDSPVGAIVGGIAGGVIGHQIGSGRGNDVATVGGAVAGAAIGANTGRGGQSYSQDVQRCANVSSGVRPEYYDVTYNFNGIEHRVQMSTPPGQTIAVNGNGEPRG